jgi:hypothetical protein
MSNEITIPGGKLPAFLTKAMSLVANDSLLVTSAPSFPRVSLKNNRFTVTLNGEDKVLGDAAKGTLNVVIIAATPNSRHRGKQYYDSEYTGGDEDVAPACWSSNGITPDATVATKQHSNCATCPKNAWGSAMSKKSNKPIKACKDIKTLYMVAPGKIDGPILTLNVPTMSLKNLAAYGQQLATYMAGDGGKVSIPVYAVVTTLAFDMDTKNSIELKFRFGGMLTEDQFVKVMERIASDEMKEVLEAASEGLQRAVVQEAVAEVTQADVWEETPEVVEVVEKPKATRAKKAAPAAQQSLFDTAEDVVPVGDQSLVDTLEAELAANGWG